MRVFITGITGTLGTALARMHRGMKDKVFGCARNESRVVEWYQVNSRVVEIVIGDAFEIDSPNSLIQRTLKTCDRVYHCAALKHVEICEQQPIEAIKENVILTSVVSLSCQLHGIDLVLASTDKALQPEGVYGATKLIAEKIVLQRDQGALRMVNLIGSSGSVLHKWLAAARTGNLIELTDPDMTRYFMTVEDAAKQMYDTGSGVYTVSNVKAVRMGELAEAIAGFGKVSIIGQRPGETKHQWLGKDQCSKDAERWNIGELLEHARKVR